MSRTRGRGLLAALAFVGLTGCSAGAPAEAPPTTPLAREVATAGLDVYAEEIIAETNRVREAERLASLETSACAREAALERAADLVGRDLEHAPLRPVLGACPPHRTAAENLVKSDATPAEVVAAWLRSPGHRSNLLAENLTGIGVGCVTDKREILCAQIFLGS